ncbi:hypothetical protein NDU88_001610 [Pleurodeles waltl]|uniref:Uncharacterized protein n=1 Tax=Pleurodeles waltl TaxID=8319 RepID=A0AAV7UV69_PLEWA|nr:hypothetical protein NDU88_001610 [Pleurodeles waltl]
MEVLRRRETPTTRDSRRARESEAELSGRHSRELLLWFRFRQRSPLGGVEVGETLGKVGVTCPARHPRVISIARRVSEPELSTGARGPSESSARKSYEQSEELQQLSSSLGETGY